MAEIRTDSIEEDLCTLYIGEQIVIAGLTRAEAEAVLARLGRRTAVSRCRPPFLLLPGTLCGVGTPQLVTMAEEVAEGSSGARLRSRPSGGPCSVRNTCVRTARRGHRRLLVSDTGRRTKQRRWAWLRPCEHEHEGADRL